MESIILKFMKKSIEIAQKNENIFVGVLAISSNNKIICSNENRIQMIGLNIFYMN